jgi:AcrR family transcriptional regulator
MEESCSPRERRRLKNEQAIMKAAQELIYEKGIEDFSIRELASRVDYSPAALYEYFPSKDDLINALAVDAGRRLGEYMYGVPADLPPEERLLRLGLAYLKFADDDPEHFVKILANLKGTEMTLEDLQHAESPYLPLVETIKQGIAEGTFKPAPGFGLDEIAYSCWSLVHGMAMLQHTSLCQLKVDFEQVNLAILKAYINCLKNGQKNIGKEKWKGNNEADQTPDAPQ